MRLVFGRIELVQAQREIQGVDIFQRGRQERDMREEENGGENGGSPPRRSAEGANARHTCRSSNPSIRLPVR